MNNITSPLRHATWLRHWPMLSVFVLGLLVSAACFFVDQQQHQKRVIEHALQDALEYQRMLQEGGASYVHLNRDVAGFFTASNDVTSEQFQTYLKSVNALETHPGLGYIGYIPRVRTTNSADFETKVRKNFPSYRICCQPLEGDFIYPLLYSFPDSPRTRKLSGFNFSSFPMRWEAMELARDLGKSIASQKHAYLVDPEKRNLISIVTPIYASAEQLETIAQRRTALRGFITATFVIEDIIEHAMGSKFKELFDLEIYDRVVSHDQILYDGDNEPHALIESGYLVVHQSNIDFAGSKWKLFFYPKPAYLKKYENRYGWLILFSGVVISFGLAFLAAKWQRRRHARRLQQEHAQRFPAVFENHPAAVYSLDLQHRFINANAKAIEYFATSKENLIGLSIEQFVVPENREKSTERFREVLNGNAASYNSAIITGKGDRIEVSVVLMPVSIEGQTSSILAISQNITAQKLAEWRLQESRQMLQVVIDNIPQRVFWKDTELHYLGCNKALSEDAGLTHPDDIVGKSDYDFVWKEQADIYRKHDRETLQSSVAKINTEEPQQRKDGSLYWLRTSKIPLKNPEGETVGVLGTYEDITERKLLEQKLEQMAHYDSLTGLPSRAFFYDHLEQAIKRSKRHGSLLGLMYFDIDRFKQINDRHGHDIGDVVIGQFAERVRATVREVDIVGRLGGDEFCLIIADLPGKEAAETVAAKLIAAMQSVLQIGELSLQISTSIGIAFHESGMAADELIRKADQAMYKAKQAGRNRYEMDSDVSMR
jgi:diguanylate cyclase (GGDEF)-like protein/PAS domain S-box-containing protein